MSRKRTIQNALPIVAAAYGEKFGVTVQIGGDVAYTNGKSIVVPNIPDDYPHMDALWGYTAHEAAHVRFTDFSVSWRPGLHQTLTNIVEDSRIEREMIKLYPGMAYTLNEVARYMASAGHYQVPTDSTHPASILEAFCLYWLQCRLVGQGAIQDLLDSTKMVFERRFPRGAVVRLNALLRKAADLKDTQEAADLADAIIKMVEEEAKQQSDQPQDDSSSQPDSQDGNDDSCGSDSGGSDDQQDQDQNPSLFDAASSDEPGAPESGQGDGDDTDARQASARAGDDTSDGDGASQVLQQVLQAGADDHIGDAHDSLKAELNEIARDQGDRRYLTVRTAQPVTPDAYNGRALRNEVSKTTAKIRTQLLGLVQASQRIGHRRSQHGKRIDARQLPRLLGGDTRVFQRNEPKRKPNTAVHILVDMSSSMGVTSSNGKRRELIAREASMAIALALDAMPGVNPAVTFFGGDSTAPVYSVVKHGEKVASNAGRFVFSPVGYTPMAEAIWYSAYELSKTREERKMLIVITDGDPDNAAPCHTVIELCEASNVEVIGIGIEHHAVRQLITNSIVIDDATELQATLFRLMERSLTAVA